MNLLFLNPKHFFMEKVLAKIACPELDREIMENPPTVATWFSCLTYEWAEDFKPYILDLVKSHYLVTHGRFSSFGLLIDELVSKGVRFPENFKEHQFMAHSYPYLVKEGILDELRLAALIGTTPERAAELNGAVTQEEKQYYAAMSSGNLNKNMDMTGPAMVEPFHNMFAEKGSDARKGADARMSLGLKDPMVHHPKHYTKGDIECIDAIAAATADLTGVEAVCTANAIKYLWRWKQKNGAQDLEKAKWYLEKLINELKK